MKIGELDRNSEMTCGIFTRGVDTAVVYSILGLACFCNLVHPNPAAATNMAIGVPSPAFDISATHELYAGRAGYADAGTGPYTHYVDNTVDHCDDEGPATAAMPLCQLPASVPAGSVIEVHGGPYTGENNRKKDIKITLNGTSTQPVILRGVAASPGARPRFTADNVTVNGSHFIVEDFIFDTARLLVGRDEPVAYAVIRNSEVKNQPSLNAVHLQGQHIVFLNNHVHHTYGDDRHGVKVTSGSQHVWILNNIIHHASGDGIQFCHNCRSNPPQYVYIANNHLFSNRENGVDLKYGKHIVISQNRIHGHRKAPRNTKWCFDDDSFCGVFSSGSDGSSIVVGSDGMPLDVLILSNDIYDNNNGIRVEEVAGAVIAGNQTYNIDSAGLVLEKAGMDVNYINNTLHNMETGVKQKSGAKFDLNLSNNIFSSIEEPLLITGQALAARMLLANNIFWNDGNALSVRWVEELTLNSGKQFDELPGRNKRGNQVANPRFVNRAGLNFNLNDRSPAIDKANDDLLTLDTAYRNRFGHESSILRDFKGIYRTNCQIDIGAHEYACGKNSSSESTPYRNPQ